MVELIIVIFKKVFVSVSLICITGLIVPSIFKLGENAVQSIVVLSFYAYCIVSLFTYSRHKLFFVLSLPVFTQFIHIFQKYAFAAGGNSIWRLLPFIVLDIYLIYFLLKHHQSDDRQKNNPIIVLWLLTNVFFLSISPNLEKIILGGIVIYLLTIPLLFCYIRITSQAYDFQPELEKYLCLLYIILGVGTFGLVYVGAGYKGSDNLLVTRNIADMNITMAYFILLWPFALLYSVKNKASIWLKSFITGIFVGVVILSFSRGAIFLVVPYILFTTVLATSFINLRLLVTISFSGFIFQKQVADFINKQDLMYFWQLRFADLGSLNSLLTKLETLSGRTEIHHTAYQLFLQKPLTGHGIGSFELLGPGFREAHSLWYTLLAEQGVIGAIFIYSLLAMLLFALIQLFLTTTKLYATLFFALAFFLLFNHTVGSTFVILPGKSITINCIAPMLLMCIYFYAENAKIQMHLQSHASA